MDATGSAFVTGSTQPTNFPITSDTFQIVLGGFQDPFVTKLSADGSSLVYSTYLGDNNNDTGTAIAVAANGNAYAAGFAGSTYFPTTPGAYSSTLRAGGDAFVTKFSTTGKELVYSTFLGSRGAVSMGLDVLGNTYAVDDMGSGGPSSHKAHVRLRGADLVADVGS